MKRVLLLLIMIILLTGCTAEVNYKLNESNISEQVIIVDRDGTKEEILGRYRKYIPVYSDETIADADPDERMTGYTYYNRDDKELNDGYKFTYNHLYVLKDFNRSNTLNRTFHSGALEYSIENGIINIYTDSNGIKWFDSYPELTNIKVNIITDLEVIKNNADSVNNNIYTWNFTKEDNEKNIYLQTKNHLYDEVHNNKNNKNDEKESEEEEKNNYLLIVALVIGSFVLLLIVLFVFKNKLSR